MHNESSTPSLVTSAAWAALQRWSPGWRTDVRVVARCALVVFLGSLPVRSEEGLKLTEPTGPVVSTEIAAVAHTNISILPVVAPRREIPAVELAETPSAAVVIKSSPLLEQPAVAVLSEMSAKPAGPGLDSRMNRETLQETIEHADRQFTPEQAGSVLRYLRRKPSWRGVLDLLDPTAPVEKLDLPAATAFEMRRSLGTPPRAFRDPTTHEPELRVF